MPRIPALGPVALLVVAGCTGGDGGADDTDSGDAGPPAAEVVSVLAGGVLDLVALDAANGEERWRAAAGSTYQALHVADDTLYALEKDQFFVTIAYDVSTGAERFRVVGEHDDLAPGPLVTGGMLLMGWDYNAIAGIDLSAPESPAWTFKTTGTPLGQGAMASGAYVFGDDEGHVYAVDPVSGTAAWQADLEGALVAGVTTTADRIYAATAPALVVALDAGSGDMLWETDIGPGDAWGLVDVGGGRVYASATGGVDNVVALDSESGDIVWRADAIEYAHTGGLRFTERGVVVPTYSGISLLDPGDGGTVWTTTSTPSSSGLPMVWGDALYLSGGGAFARLDLATGAAEWTIENEDVFNFFATPSLLLDDGTAVNATDPRD